MNNFINRLRSFYEVNRHSGVTLVELLVALALIGTITTITTAAILSTTQTSQNFTQGVNNENNLVDAISKVSRDVSLTKEFKYAGANSLSMLISEDGAESQVYYFVWNGSTSTLPTSPEFDTIRTNKAKLPSDYGLVEYRVVNKDTSNPVVRTVIPGYKATGQIFTYFDSSDKVVDLDSSTKEPAVLGENLSTIRRVEMDFSNNITSRNNSMEMHTSAVPRLLGIAAQDEGANLTFGDTNGKLAAPNLNGNLPQQTNTASLWWSSVAGADSYTLYSSQDGADYKTIANIQQNSGKLTYTIPDLNWGSTYSYKIVANDHRGASDDSNIVALRVTPQATKFANISPKRGLAGEDWKGYTVARNLQNSLYWDNANAHKDTRFRISESANGAAYATLWDATAGNTNIESGKNYGDISKYKVTAYNQILQVNNPDGSVYQTGGAAKDSAEVTLVSPPVKPTMTGTVANDLTDSKLTAPTNTLTISNYTTVRKTAKSLTYKVAETNASGSSYGGAVKPITTTSTSANFTYKDDFKGVKNYTTTKGWGTREYYFATASNDAGNSPVSTSVKLDQPPGPFNITKLANPSGYANYFSQAAQVASGTNQKSVGNITGTFTKSLGATSGYTLSRDVQSKYASKAITTVKDPVTGSNVNMESGATLKATDTTFNLKGSSPGVVYDFSLVAKSAQNGLTRTETSTLLTRPDVPQKGYVEAMCKADGKVGSAQTLGSYIFLYRLPSKGISDATTVVVTKSKSQPNPKSQTNTTDSQWFIWSQFSGLHDRVTYAITNKITTKAVPDSAAEFRERESATVPISFEYMSYFGVPCDYDHSSSGREGSQGNDVKELAAATNRAWVIHKYVCYGYDPDTKYGNFWVIKGKEEFKGYVTKGSSSMGTWIRKKDYINSDGCIWRLSPDGGSEPVWYSIN